jgi:hypothetical protein
MTIFAGHKAHLKNLSISAIPLIHMVQNKMINYENIVSVLDCVDENLSEVESSDSDNEISKNQESGHKVEYQTVNTVMGKWLSGWCDVNGK